MSVCYFTFSQPSNASNFGAHCMRFTYTPVGITRSYFNTENQQIANGNGVYQEQYVMRQQRFAEIKRHLDQGGELTEDKSGVAEYRYKRDQKGRRISELRLDIEAKVVPEHNGFYEARFAFDTNDYATYRKGYDEKGNIMQGPKGYATAYFWFDDNGAFLKEEFRDAQDNMVLGPTGDYARIEYDEIDRFGNWHKVKFFDEYGKPSNKSAALGVANYYDFNRRKSIAFFDVKMRPATNGRGVAQYIYVYDSDKEFIKREAYSLKGEIISEN